MDQYSATVTTPTPPAGAGQAPEVPFGQTEVAELLDQAKETATNTAHNVSGMLNERMDSGVHLAGQRLEGVAKNLHEVAGTLEERGNTSAAKLMERAAEPADRATKYLATTNTRDMLDDAGRYARQHLWTVVVGGALLGMVASRFLKASLSAPAATSPGAYPAA